MSTFGPLQQISPVVILHLSSTMDLFNCITDYFTEESPVIVSEELGSGGSGGGCTVA